MKTRKDLAAILARSIGEEAALEHIDRVARTLGLGVGLSSAEALRVLEQLAVEPGLIGVAARFAKARVHLAWA